MEKSGLFQIGDIAKLFHLSVGILRHYEKQGLLQPEYIDPETGYRYYSTRQFESLNTIRYLRVLDTPLDQIAEFLKNRDINHIQELLRQQKETVIRKRKELETIERKIDNRLRQIEDAVSSELDVIRFVTYPTRRITWIRNPLSIESYLDLEVPIRQLEDEFEGNVEKLPTETCVTLRFCGSHADAPAQYQKLVTFINDHSLQIAGFSKEITMIDYGITNDTDKFVTEIQIPIYLFNPQ